MAHQYHEYFNPAQASAFNETGNRRDSSFELTYFGIHGYANTAREIIVASGAKFKNTVVTHENWPAQKPFAPFGVVPLLKETSSDGNTVIKVSESDAIERYLARKFGLLGDNIFEETLINTFSSNGNGLVGSLFSKYYHLSSAERVSKRETVLNDHVLPWIKYHEQHLAANGSNGHYVGSKLSLADFKTSYLIKILLPIIGGDTITETKTPGLWNLKTTIDTIPSLAAWRASDEYKALDKANFERIGY